MVKTTPAAKARHGSCRNSPPSRWRARAPRHQVRRVLRQVPPGLKPGHEEHECRFFFFFFFFLFFSGWLFPKKLTKKGRGPKQTKPRSDKKGHPLGLKFLKYVYRTKSLLLLQWRIGCSFIPQPGLAQSLTCGFNGNFSSTLKT